MGCLEERWTGGAEAIRRPRMNVCSNLHGILLSATGRSTAVPRGRLATYLERIQGTMQVLIFGGAGHWWRWILSGGRGPHGLALAGEIWQGPWTARSSSACNSGRYVVNNPTHAHAPTPIYKHATRRHARGCASSIIIIGSRATELACGSLCL